MQCNILKSLPFNQVTSELLNNTPGLYTETRCKENFNRFLATLLDSRIHGNGKRGDAEGSFNLRPIFITPASPLISAIMVGTASDNWPIKSAGMGRNNIMIRFI